MFSEIRPKSCTYGCGVEIYWNTEENTYYELYSRKKHICPNLLTYNKDSTSVPPATVSKPSYYTKEPSNTNESTTKTRFLPLFPVSEGKQVLLSKLTKELQICWLLSGLLTQVNVIF